jgi:hypothetical protein
MNKRQWLEHSEECFYCKERFIGRFLNEASADHIIPRAYWRNNNTLTVLACRRCNQLKGHMLNDQFYTKILQLVNQESVRIKNAKNFNEKQTAIQLNTYYSKLLVSIKELDLILTYISKEVNLYSINKTYSELLFPEIKIEAILEGIIQMKKKLENKATVFAAIEIGTRVAIPTHNNPYRINLAKGFRVHWLTTLSLYDNPNKSECFYQILSSIEKGITQSFHFNGNIS